MLNRGYAYKTIISSKYRGQGLLSHLASAYPHSTAEAWQQNLDNGEVIVDGIGMRQTIVLGAGKKTEQDEGAYFPLWLRNFVTALTDPVPNATAWTTSGAMIEQITVRDGRESAPRIRLSLPV